MLLPDGTHLYMSTRCLHGDHEACKADTLDGVGVRTGTHAAIKRNPAQCKHCGAPCICAECNHPGGAEALNHAAQFLPIMARRSANFAAQHLGEPS